MNGIKLALNWTLFGSLAAGLAACAGSEAKAPDTAVKNDGSDAHAAHVAAQPWERDPFTRTSEILTDGAVVGYLVEYQAIPVGVLVERALPTGSYRIQGVHFEELGFVTPRGDVRRYVAGGSESLGVWRLDEGLRRFFGKSSRVQLKELAPLAPAKAAAPAKGEKKGEEGDAKKDGDAGGEKKKDASGGK
jgi:hypothetical protein